MKNVEEKIKGLLISELVRKNEEGDIDVNNFNSLIFLATRQSTIRELFYISRWPGKWSDKQSALKQLLETLTSEEIKKIDANRFENILQPAHMEATKIIQNEAKARQRISTTIELSGKNASPPKKTEEKNKLNTLYLLVIFVFIVVLAPLVWLGYASKPTINVEFNIGEIIGGLLIGVSAVSASFTYARKNTVKNEREQKA
jgi:hypothetical protein